jgi:hypothetical protein
MSEEMKIKNEKKFEGRKAGGFRWLAVAVKRWAAKSWAAGDGC